MKIQNQQIAFKGNLTVTPEIKDLVSPLHLTKIENKVLQCAYDVDLDVSRAKNGNIKGLLYKLSDLNYVPKGKSTAMQGYEKLPLNSFQSSENAFIRLKNILNSVGQGCINSNAKDFIPDKGSFVKNILKNLKSGIVKFIS